MRSRSLDHGRASDLFLLRCHRDAGVRHAAVSTPARVGQRRFWECTACQAWVGCHMPRGDDDPECPRPLGTPADASLRRWRNSAHALFDPLWQSGRMSRGQAYEWLAEKMGLTKAQCFIGGFTEAQCKAVVEICARAPGDDAPVGEDYMQAMREFADEVARSGNAPKTPSLL